MSDPFCDSGAPHMAGHASCDECAHEWVAVWPMGADALECPNCGSHETDRHEELQEL